STLAISDVARATVLHLVNESHRKDEQIKELTGECERRGEGLTKERIKTARLETAKDVPLGVIGMAVLGLAALLGGVTTDTTVRVYSGVFALLGVAGVVMSLRRVMRGR